MTLSREVSEPRSTHRVAQGIIDCDVHVAMADERHLLKHIPERWRAYRRSLGGFTYESEFYPRPTANAARVDAWPPSGLPPGADLAFVRDQLLEAWAIEHAVLTPLPYPGAQRNPDYAAALSRAWNEWQLEEWVEPEPRFHASVYVAQEDPDAAVAEIELRAGDPRFVQVFILVGTNEPAGKRRYWKIYDAAAAAGLPVALHFGGLNGYANSGAGFFSYYIENHVATAMMFQDQVSSLIFEGAFEAVPNLKVVLVEGGVTWLAPLMWRLDLAWERLRDEIPHVRRPPSAYIRKHLWMTTQPIEEPPRASDFVAQLDYLDMWDRLMFSSDYPHWDFDAPDRALPTAIPPQRRQQILGDNARSLYRLPK